MKPRKAPDVIDATELERKRCVRLAVWWDQYQTIGDWGLYLRALQNGWSLERLKEEHDT